MYAKHRDTASLANRFLTSQKHDTDKVGWVSRGKALRCEKEGERQRGVFPSINPQNSPAVGRQGMPEAMLVDAGYAGVVGGRAKTVYLSIPSCLVLWVLAKRRFRPAGSTGQRRKEASTLWRLP